MEFTRTRLSIESVEKVEEYLKLGYSYSKINHLTGVSKGSISKIKNGTYKKVEPEYKIEDDPKYKKLYKAYRCYKKAYGEQEIVIQNLEQELKQCKEQYKKLINRTNDINNELNKYKSSNTGPKINFF